MAFCGETEGCGDDASECLVSSLFSCGCGGVGQADGV